MRSSKNKIGETINASGQGSGEQKTMAERLRSIIIESKNPKNRKK
jgi:hypothetical protein